MKKILPAVLFFFCVLAAVCAVDIYDESIYANPLQEGDTGFEAVKASFSPSPMTADYTQIKTVRRLDKNFESSGRMIILPGTGIVWITEKPYASKMVAGRSGMKQQVGSRIVAMDVSQNGIYLSFAGALESIFAGEFSGLEDVFDLFFTADEGRWFLGLVPRDENVKAFIRSITIEGSGTVDAVLMEENSGDSVLYRLENVEQRKLTEDEEKEFSF